MLNCLHILLMFNIVINLYCNEPNVLSAYSTNYNALVATDVKNSNEVNTGYKLDGNLNSLNFRKFAYLRWINNNEILIVEYNKNDVQRVIRFNVKQKRFISVYNPDYSDKINCIFSSNGKYIANSYMTEDRISVLKNGNVIFDKSNFKDFLISGCSRSSDRESLKKTMDRSIIGRELMFVNEKRIIILYTESKYCFSHPLFLADIDYINGKVIKIIWPSDDTFIYRPFVQRVQRGVNRIIAIEPRYVSYYNENRNRMIQIHFQNIILIHDHDAEIMDNEVYFAGRYPHEKNDSFFVVKKETSQLKRLYDKVTSFIITNKYLLLLYQEEGFKWKNIRLIRRSDGRSFDIPELNTKKPLTIFDYILFSPTEDKIIVFNTDNDKIKIINL